MRNDLVFSSTKTYTHAVGLSCCFRQHKAESHCRFLHGYALEVKLTFTSPTLDERNWVVDFGSLKPIKQWLERNFDHKLLIAKDDPYKEQLMALDYRTAVHTYEEMEATKLADVIVVDAVGCEAFSLQIYEHVEKWLSEYCETHHLPNAFLESVEVKEHQGNSAICRKRSPYGMDAINEWHNPQIVLSPNHKVNIETVGSVQVIVIEPVEKK